MTEQTTIGETVTEAATNEVIGTIQESVEKTSGFFADAAVYLKNALPLIIVALLILVLGILISKLIAKIVTASVVYYYRLSFMENRGKQCPLA